MNANLKNEVRKNENPTCKTFTGKNMKMYSKMSIQFVMKK